MLKTIIGIDLAATTGIAAISLKEECIRFMELKPFIKTDQYPLKAIDLFYQISQLVYSYNKLDIAIGIERFTYFGKSALTQLNLASFYGYVYFTLLEKEYNVTSVYPLSARKKILTDTGIKNKKQLVNQYLSDLYDCKMTDNESDALTVALSLVPEGIEWQKFYVKDYKLAW